MCVVKRNFCAPFSPSARQKSWLYMGLGEIAGSARQRQEPGEEREYAWQQLTLITRGLVKQPICLQSTHY